MGVYAAVGCIAAPDAKGFRTQGFAPPASFGAAAADRGVEVLRFRVSCFVFRVSCLGSTQKATVTLPPWISGGGYRGTSPTKKTPPPGTYSRTKPRALLWS